MDIHNTLELDELASAREIKVPPPWRGRNAAPYHGLAVLGRLAVTVFPYVMPNLCGEVLEVAGLFESGDGAVESQQGRAQERDARLVTGFARLSRTPCFEVSRRLLWRDKRIETYTRACIALIDSTGPAESVVSIDRVPTQKKYALDKNSCSRPSL